MFLILFLFLICYFSLLIFQMNFKILNIKMILNYTMYNLFWENAFSCDLKIFH